jgi:hypothetical protein
MGTRCVHGEPCRPDTTQQDGSCMVEAPEPGIHHVMLRQRRSLTTAWWCRPEVAWCTTGEVPACCQLLL